MMKTHADLPALPPDGGRALGASEAVVASSGGDGVVYGEGHILLVEDDRMVSRTAIATLKALGYRVTHAANGAAALGLAREAEPRFDLVLLDLSMPGLSGQATFEALLDVAPDLRVLIWSGHAANQDVASMLRRGAVGFVQKPYGVPQLSRALAEALRAARA